MLDSERPVGRFAPSPTGELHFGSLLAAMASYCQARHNQGCWSLRIDDIDPPRAQHGAADSIQRTLEQYGFQWDGPVVWQSHNLPRYREALNDLAQTGHVFSCGCSRKQRPQGPYPGTCRSQTLSPYQCQPTDRALRLQLPDQVCAHDLIQGPQNFALSAMTGDVIIWRRDGLVAYALACAIDDAVEHAQVIRGADLLPSTGAQLAIIRSLALPEPQYGHIPVALNVCGDKLSKHSQARAINTMEPLSTLMAAWQCLGQTVFNPATIDEFWQQAVCLWQLSQVPTVRQLNIKTTLA